MAAATVVHHADAAVVQKAAHGLFQCGYAKPRLLGLALAGEEPGCEVHALTIAGTSALGVKTPENLEEDRVGPFTYLGSRGAIVAGHDPQFQHPHAVALRQVNIVECQPPGLATRAAVVALGTINPDVRSSVMWRDTDLNCLLFGHAV
jgi:hypothetical protein